MKQEDVIKRLRHECQTMRSRIEAIRTCEYAVGHLEADDVFGQQYSRLLFSDVRELTEAISMADKVLGTNDA